MALIVRASCLNLCPQSEQSLDRVRAHLQFSGGIGTDQNHRLAVRIAALLLINLVNVRHLETASVIGFDCRVERSELRHGVQDSIFCSENCACVSLCLTNSPLY